MANQKLNRRGFIRSVGAGVLAASVARNTFAKQQIKPPNIVIMLADDQGWGDLSLHGNANLSTPNIDSLARDGAMFDRFFVCPVCAPTRAEFLTGRYYPTTGVHGVSTGAERMNPDEVTIADTFKAAGYATGAFGKWHNGMQYPYHPNARGFDEYYGFCSGHWGQYFDPILEHNGKIVRGKGYITDDLTEHAMDFIEKNKDKPFFCYVPYNTPHSPMQVPDRFFEKFKNDPIAMKHRDEEREDIPKTSVALAMCENIDWNVGRILAKLEELDIADNTIVIYFSDNGPNSYRWNDRMKGRKGSPDEGGLRVPCLFRWPGHIKPGLKISQIAGAIDFLPTLSDMAGISTISTKPLDGISIKPLLTAKPSTWNDRMIFTYRKNGASVRTQQYRMDPQGQLFDMTADPEQRTDLSKERPEIAKKLSQAKKRWLDSLPDVENDQRPFSVGYPEFPSTMLPARDGVAVGKVKRSAKAPNCSFFTNWRSTDDKMTWNIEVANSGNYKAEIYYACPKKDLGSTVELEFNGSRVSGKVTKANNPPLIGASFDRVERGSESYVKDFKPMSLGKFKLKKGKGTLTLRALEIPGDQAMEVRLVMLTLLK